jgi:hypothetical protein
VKKPIYGCRKETKRSPRVWSKEGAVILKILKIKDTSRKRIHGYCDDTGYTLIETVISLVLLIAIAVPLITRFYYGNTLHESRAELTGIWLIEQEAALIRAFPSKILPVKRRYCDMDEWTLRTTVIEKKPVHYRITAELRGKVHAQSTFYGRAEDGKK